MVFNLDPSLSTILSQKILPLQRLRWEIKKLFDILIGATNSCLFLGCADQNKTDEYGCLIVTISIWAPSHAPHRPMMARYWNIHLLILFYFLQTQKTLSVSRWVGLLVRNTVELYMFFCITVPAQPSKTVVSYICPSWCLVWCKCVKSPLHFLFFCSI